MKTILLIDDHEITRVGFRMVVERKGELTLLEAGTLKEGMAQIDAHPGIDLVILDMTLPDAVGLPGYEELHAHAPQLPVAVMTARGEVDLMTSILRAGAVGFIPKATPSARLLPILQLILSGGRYVPEELIAPDSNAESIEPVNVSGYVAEQPVQRVVAPGVLDILTMRQRDVANLLAGGFSNKEICRTLGISLGTAKNHVAAILHILGTPSRAKAITIIRDSVLPPGHSASSNKSEIGHGVIRQR